MTVSAGKFAATSIGAAALLAGGFYFVRGPASDEGGGPPGDLSVSTGSTGDGGGAPEGAPQGADPGRPRFQAGGESWPVAVEDSDLASSELVARAVADLNLIFGDFESHRVIPPNEITFRIGETTVAASSFLDFSINPGHHRPAPVAEHFGDTVLLEEEEHVVLSGPLIAAYDTELRRWEEDESLAASLEGFLDRMNTLSPPIEMDDREVKECFHYSPDRDLSVEVLRGYLVEMSKHRIRRPSLLDRREEEGLVFYRSLLLDKETGEIVDEIMLGVFGSSWRVVF